MLWPQFPCDDAVQVASYNLQCIINKQKNILDGWYVFIPYVWSEVKEYEIGILCLTVLYIYANHLNKCLTKILLICTSASLSPFLFCEITTFTDIVSLLLAIGRSKKFTSCCPPDLTASQSKVNYTYILHLYLPLRPFEKVGCYFVDVTMHSEVQ